MSRKPSPIPRMPEDTARVARAAFPKGTPYLLLRDELGVIFTDEDFADLFPQRSQRALAPGGWHWSPSCSFASMYLTAKRQRRYERASTGSIC